MKSISVVYKYTSVNTFQKIIAGKKLRLADIQSSNDTSELKLIYGVVKKVFIEEFEKEKPNYIKNYFPTDQFISFYEENTRSIDAIENILHTQYTTCFSSDGDMLSQWRGYGDDGNGVSIGFDISSFPNNDQYKFGRVEYTDRGQKALFRNDVKEIIKSLRQYVKKNHSIDGYPVHEFMRSYNVLLLKAVLVKNSFFHEEREWRYSYWYNKTEEFKEYKFAKNTIKSIIIGPKSTLTKKEIEQLLQKFEFDNVDVSYSRGHGIYVDSKNQKTASKE